MDDIYAPIGTASRNRVDVRAVVAEYFPTHASYVAWRDGDPRAARLLGTRDDLADALIGIGLRRGGRQDESSDEVLEFEDPIEAERFRDWCRPE